MYRRERAETDQIDTHSHSQCNAPAQRGCGFSLSGDIQDPPGQGPLQPAVGDPASAGGLD